MAIMFFLLLSKDAVEFSYYIFASVSFIHSTNICYRRQCRCCLSRKLDRKEFGTNGAYILIRGESKNKEIREERVTC